MAPRGMPGRSFEDDEDAGEDDYEGDIDQQERSYDELEEKVPAMAPGGGGGEHFADEVDAADEEAQATQLERRFFECCRSGNRRALERMLVVRRDLVCATGRRLNTPLHMAAEHKQPSVAQLLLAHGANVDEVNQDGQTPLHLAAAVGSSALIRVLGNAGATIDARSKVSPTMAGSYRGRRGRDLIQWCVTTAKLHATAHGDESRLRERSDAADRPRR
jgi:hypothetical protein